MNYLTQALREHQELAVFLTLAIGFFIGRFKIGTFSLGIAVGTLLAGVAIGQLNIQVPAVVKYVFFDLFLFCLKALFLFFFSMATLHNAQTKIAIVYMREQSCDTRDNMMIPR